MRSVRALPVLLVVAWVASCGSSSDTTTDAALTGGGGCTAETAVAATDVTVSDFKYVPACIKVAAGATVTWTNAGMASHTVTSDADAPVTFNSGALGSGGTFHFTFPAAGTVGYYCIPHESLGMKGTVVVE
jgi:plastocyanin